MNNKEIFKVWADSNSIWSNWVKPIIFINLSDDCQAYFSDNYELPNVNYIYDEKVAIIIDLPGAQSVLEAMKLAKLGYRPIPIYNGTTEQNNSKSAIDNKIIQVSILNNTINLSKIKINSNANPVFMIDSNRTNRIKNNNQLFDNSWDIYPQDLPSSEFFLNNNIKKILVRSSIINNDLQNILYKLQSRGLQILFTDGFSEIKVIKVKKGKNI